MLVSCSFAFKIISSYSCSSLISLPRNKLIYRYFSFLTGDDRVNAEPSLAVMHTVWHREHNRIAKKLREINSEWSDEIVYQEARRIVIAEIQHITYKEWLPTVLGKAYIENIGLGIGPGQTTNYSSYDDPAVSNEAATAVFRFLNSLKQGQLR